MSYGMQQGDTCFFIPKANYAAACEALKLFIQTDGDKGYIYEKEAVSACNDGDLVKALLMCRWICVSDDTGIIDIKAETCKLGVDDLVFGAIAPYVSDGSYIKMLGQEGDSWRWRFKNGKLYDERARLVYEGDPAYSVIREWASGCEGGMSVLCVTHDIKKARRILNENIDIEKKNSWIADHLASVGDAAVSLYREERSKDHWIFYKKDAYREAHTTIKIFKCENKW